MASRLEQRRRSAPAIRAQLIEDPRSELLTKMVATSLHMVNASDLDTGDFNSSEGNRLFRRQNNS
jgi:hypothetical protein